MPNGLISQRIAITFGRQSMQGAFIPYKQGIYLLLDEFIVHH